MKDGRTDVQTHSCTPLSQGKFMHTCHTSHCETKSHRILDLLDPVTHKIFKSHRIFIPFNKLFFEELEINQTSAWLSQA